MPFLCDASSLIPLIKRMGEDAAETLSSARILELTVYEVGNGLWSEAHRKSVTEEEAVSLASITSRILASMQRIATPVGDFVEVLSIASRENLTFYDASYIQAAKKHNLTLVTEDRSMARASRKYVPTKNVLDIGK